MVVHRQRRDDRLCRDAQTRQWRQLERNRRDRSKSRVAVNFSTAASCKLDCLKQSSLNGASVFALEEIICERVESVAFRTESRQCTVRLFREASRFRARFLQTNDGRISRFLRCDIFARALAKFLARLGDVENIVDHLKRETERASKFCDCAELFWIRVCAHRAEPDGSSQDRGSLVFVNVTQTRHVDLFSFAFEIGDLSG